MVHIGIGNFHRAHQAWYTANAPDTADWGIAAFTARRPDMADQLAPQDGLYTLITRSAAGDDFRVIGSLAAVHPSTDHEAYLNYLRRSELAVVTITVTEVGYLAGPDGRLDRTKEAVQTDIAALRGDGEAQVSSVPGKLVAGLLARRSTDVGPITILPCDNLPESGPLTPRVRHQLSQIAPDGSRKLPIRILPTLRAERAAGRMPIGCATVIAAWILHLRGYGAPLKDPGAGDAQTAAADPDVPSAVRGVLGTWDPDLPTDADLVETIAKGINALEEPSS